MFFFKMMKHIKKLIPTYIALMLWILHILFRLIQYIYIFEVFELKYDFIMSQIVLM